MSLTNCFVLGVMLIPVYLDVVDNVHSEVSVGILGGLDAGLKSLYHVLLVRLRHEQDLHLRPTIGSKGDKGDNDRDVAQHLRKVGLIALPAKYLRSSELRQTVPTDICAVLQN